MPFPLPPDERDALCAEFQRLLNADVDATLDRLRDARGTVVLNSDDLFKVLPRYEANVEERKFLGPLLYEVAKEFTDQIYARLLARPVGENNEVVFTAGGSATGKSTILRTEGPRPEVDFIVDTTFSNVERALSQVDRALASGRQVRIYYVYRDFLESLRSMLERAQNPLVGRVVPVDDMARTHFGAQGAVLEAVDKYQQNGRVEISLNANTGAGKLELMDEKRFFELLYPSVDSLQEKGQILLDELRRNSRSRRGDDGEDHDPAGQDLFVSEALYEAARSKAKAPEPPLG